MNTRFRRLITLLVLPLLLIIPAGCAGFGQPLSPEDMETINQEIRVSIEETFPLPEQVMIKTHVGDDLRFSTALSLDEVVAFYRDAYTQKGYEAEAGDPVLAGGVTLLFKKDGEKDVLLEVTENESGSDVHLLLNTPIDASAE
ncbi:MAG: hypothetical protein HYZ21_04650 [Chloroflexi bacterium]|nr:hypothetical protein [Chloroflexota bacterium]